MSYPEINIDNVTVRWIVIESNLDLDYVHIHVPYRHLQSMQCHIALRTSHKHDTCRKYHLLIEIYRNMHAVACEHACACSMHTSLK